MANYRLKKEYLKGVHIVIVGDAGIRIDSDFFNRYDNPHLLIENNKGVGHFFEDLDGKPVNDEPKPAAKKATNSKKPSVKKAK